MKVLAFAASNSRQSINKRLVAHAADVLTSEILPSAEIRTIDLNDYEMLLYSIDREREDGIPQRARDFYDAIGGADAVIASFAEHNGAFTVAYKNVYDWASRINSKVYQGKPMVALATSPGGRGGTNVLNLVQQLLPRFGAELKATVSVPRFSENFDRDTGRLTNPEHQSALRDALSLLVAK